MSQYPIVTETGLYEAVNYLASGPAGLGQNFNGFSTYEPAYLTGSFRQPFTVSTTATTNPPTWYVDPIAINNIVRQNVNNGKTGNLEWTFTTPQAQPPFRVGQTIYVRNVSPDYYNDRYTVLTCSTTSFQTQDFNVYSYPAYVSGGEVYLNNSNMLTSTDANARVTVQGPTDIVFISSQLQLTTGYSADTTSTFDVLVQINRYTGSVDTAGRGAIDYLFSYDKTVSEQLTTFTVEPGDSTVNAGQNIFTTVLDQPSFGYYWYIAEVTFVTKPTYRYNGQGQLVTGELWNGTFTGTNSGVVAYYSGLSVVNVNSSGTGGSADVDITSTATNYAQSARVDIYDGSGYAVGDTIKILGTDLGGATPANDMLITITQIRYPGSIAPTVQTVGLRSMTAQVIKQ